MKTHDHDMPNKRVVTGQLTGRLYQQRRETQPWKTDSAAGKRSPSSNKSKRAAARCAWPLRSTEAPVLLAGGLARDSPRGPRRDKPSGSSCRSRHAPFRLQAGRAPCSGRLCCLGSGDQLQRLQFRTNRPIARGGGPRIPRSPRRAGARPATVSAESGRRGLARCSLRFGRAFRFHVADSLVVVEPSTSTTTTAAAIKNAAR